MAKNKEFPLSLVIRAVDKATAPLRKVNERMRDMTKNARKLNNSMRAFAVEAGLPRLVKGFQGVGGAVRNVGREAFSLGTRFAALAAGATFAFVRVVQGAVKAGDDLATFSNRVGLSVDAYAQLQYAAAQADVEQTQFATALDQLTKRLGEAKAGTGSLLDFLKKASPVFAKQIQNASGTEEAFNLLARAFERIPDPARRAALANAAFGRSGMQMGVFLAQGSKAIDEQRERFAELMGSQEDFANGAGALDNAMRETETAFLGLKNAAAGALFPALTELAQAITRLVSGNREGLREWAKTTGQEIINWVKSGGVERLVAGLKEFGASVKTIADSLGGLKGVLAAVGLVMSSSFLVSVLTLGKALWGLGAAALPMLLKGFMLALPYIAAAAHAIGGALASALTFVAPMFGAMASGIAAAAAAAAPFIAAAGGLALAGYAVYQNWNQLKELFTDFTGPGGLLSTMKEMLTSFEGLSPLHWLKNAGEWWGGQITGGGDRPTLGAAGAAPAPPAAPQSQAHVTVDFNNAPPGTRVQQSSSSDADLDLSMGYTMAGP